MVTFTVPGEPCGKGRARTVNAHGRKMSYTPEKTTNYEALVKLMFRQAAGDFFLGAGVPVRMRIDAYYSTPKSESKKRLRGMLMGLLFPTKKPDWDNIGKIVSDALNGVAYKDDAQVVDGRVVKHYSDVPHTDVLIEEVCVESAKE